MSVAIRPVLTHGSETWAVGKRGENLLRSFDKKAVRKIFGPVLENGFWRRPKISEMYKLRHKCNVVKFIKLGRREFAGHVMTEESDP